MLWYTLMILYYFDINTIIITKLKTIHWLMLQHGKRNGIMYFEIDITQVHGNQLFHRNCIGINIEIT